MTTPGSPPIPAVTAEQIREVDRVMVEELHIELVQMMENAGRNLADMAFRRFRPDSVTVLAGGGGNGGGGLVAARHLANRGVALTITIANGPRGFGPVPAHQLDIVNRVGISVTDQPQPASLVIHALIGYSLDGDPTGPVAELIEWASTQVAPVLALDVPSGLDATTGSVGTPCVGATATLTSGLAKTGLIGATHTGELFLADISILPTVFARLGITVPPVFRDDTVIRLCPRRGGPEGSGDITTAGQLAPTPLDF